MKIYLFSWKKNVPKNFLFSPDVSSLLGAVVKKDENGMPYVEKENVFLSYTHSGNSAALAVADFPVGIDMEIPRDVDFRKISCRFFSMEDQAMIRSQRDFFFLWTKKESFFKLSGKGGLAPSLKYPLPSDVFFKTLETDDAILTVACRHSNPMIPEIKKIYL